MARIRVNLSFFPEEADLVIPEDVFNKLTEDKALKKETAKKKQQKYCLQHCIKSQHK